MEPGANPVTVLAVSSSHEALASLSAIFSHSRWRLFQARSCAEAISFLEAHPVPVVISEQNLSDATWRDLLAYVVLLPNPSHLIVASRCADDRLWAEALNLGAHDVLAMPFRAAEVSHSVSLAWRQWKEESGHTDRAFCTAYASSAAAR